jgi:hypothetical protein
MPLSEQALPASESASQPKPVLEPEPADEPEQPAKSAVNIPLIALIGIGAVVIAAIVIFIVKRKPAKPDEGNGESLSDQTEFAGADGDATMFLIADAGKKGGSGHYLILNDLAQPHKRFEVLVSGKVEVGRNPNQPGIVIDYDKRISRQHFAVVKRDGGLWIEDLGAVNKTYVNDTVITTPQILRDNDVISCGKTKLSVKIERR